MRKRTRTILFLICVFTFLLISPCIVLYSQGYRFNFENKKITKTGGLFLKILPKQVEIYLDDKFVKKTDFFFGSALIETLLPKKYKIKVEKNGYFPWEKNLEVEEGKVTEVKNIILFPRSPGFRVLTKEIEKFWPSPDEKKIVLYEINEKGWVLKLYDPERDVKSHLINEKDIFTKGANLINLEFSKDSKEIYLDLELQSTSSPASKTPKAEERYFTLRIDKVPPVLIERDREDKFPIENAVFHQKINNDIYYLDNFGYLFKTDSSFGTKSKINEKPLQINKEAKYKLEIFGDYIFLIEDKILYLFNPEDKSFEKLFEPIANLKISPDNKKLVYFSDREIWILFLSEKLTPPTEEAGGKIFLTRFGKKIGDVFWLNSDYLVLNVENEIKISEIDTREKINMVDLAEFNDPRIFFNKTNEKLYILSEKNFFGSEKILP